MILYLAAGAVLPPAVTGVFQPFYAWLNRLRGKPYGRREFLKDWLWVAAAYSVIFALQRYALPWPSTGAGVSAAVAAWLLWRRKHKRRRAPSLAGAKSRALIAALIRQMAPGGAA